MTAIEDADISKSTNRFTTNTTYNEAGMVIADNKFRSMNFSYDANGRQVIATNATNSTNAQTVYDALGNRVATKINDSWQFVIYDAFGKLVAEYGTQSEGNGGVSYVLQDWQGSVRASVNNNGFIQARFDFTAFGEEINLNVGLRSIEQGYSGDATSRNGYGLTEKDSSGLNHTWFRKQEQRAGRWTSPDPYNGSMNLNNPQSFNRYSYVGGDAVNFVDPSGLLAEGDLCQLNPNDRDAEGNPLYQGTIRNGRCESHAGNTATFYYNFPIFGNYSHPGNIFQQNQGQDYGAGGFGLPPINAPVPTKPIIEVPPRFVDPGKLNPNQPEKLPIPESPMLKARLIIALIIRAISKIISNIPIMVDPKVLCEISRKEGTEFWNSPLCVPYHPPIFVIILPK